MQLSKVGARRFVGEFNSAANFLQLSDIVIPMIGLLVPVFFFMFILQFYCYSLFCSIVWGLNSVTLASFLFLQNQILRHEASRTSGLLWVIGRDLWMNVNYNIFSCCFCSYHHWLATQHKSEKDVVINSQSTVDAAHFSSLMASMLKSAGQLIELAQGANKTNAVNS